MYDNKRKVVLSLYDFTGEALKPWAEAGYECYAFDIQHDSMLIETYEGGGSIHYVRADLHEPKTFTMLLNQFHPDELAFAMAFPVCTDMAVSGAAHFASKLKADPEFQTKAVTYATMCADFFDALKVPYFIENPVSVLATKWRKPNYTFHPYLYGGYIPLCQAEHPEWPQYIAPRDAYKKKTCLWTGNEFVMPTFRPVSCEAYHGNGYATAMMKLGGKSMRTKNIRSATPRGFARAVYEANT
jgi:hypothetical protein